MLLARDRASYGDLAQLITRGRRAAAKGRYVLGRDDIAELGRDCLITPGFFDTHLHAPQLEMIGSYGGHLLEWLNRYTFPTEAKFADPDHARMIAAAFYDQLLHNGTLCALIFSTIHAARPTGESAMPYKVCGREAIILAYSTCSYVLISCS